MHKADLQNAIDVALIVDRNVLPGAHVLIKTTAANSKRPLVFHVLHHGLDLGEIAELEETLFFTNNECTVEFHTVDINQFSRLPSLHGNWMTYAKFKINNFVKTDFCIYIDTDVICNGDISLLAGYADKTKFICASKSGTVATAYDKELAEESGISLERAYFNAGVMLFNTRLWNKNNIDDKIIEWAYSNRKLLKSHDQSALNYYFEPDDVGEFPSEYNAFVYPADSSYIDKHGVLLHFVGSPKPWDPLAYTLTNHGRMFEKILRSTAYETKRRTIKCRIAHYGARARRAFFLLRSYQRLITTNRKRGSI